MDEISYSLKFKKISFFIIFLWFSLFLYSVDYFEEGKKFLSMDQPDIAIPSLYTASKETTTDPSVFLYLGVAYLRAGKYPEALHYLSIGQKKDEANSYFYPYNMGNIYFLQNRFDLADTAYTGAIDSNNFFAPAFLNRANTRMKLTNYQGALQDYKIYLQLEPTSIQKPSIQKMISLLEENAKEAEMLKALEAARRDAEEAEKVAAEERYRQLMEDVNSNFSSVDDADALSAGAEDTIDYSEDNELD